MDIQNQQKLLLHVCCAPCSSYVLEYLYSKYNITAFFYNPNITIWEEYEKRIGELKRFVGEAPFAKNVAVVEGIYNPEKFIEISKNLENEPERGIRCYKCYELRLRETAIYALEHKYDLFTTTLSISPHKNAEWLNEIGTDRITAGAYTAKMKLIKEKIACRQSYIVVQYYICDIE